MSRGVNMCIFIGTVGRDPEVRYMSGSGGAITTVSIAVNESWKDKQTGEKKERAEWVNLVFFGRLAEVVGEHVEKGKQIYVQGRMQTDKYEKDGVTKYATKIVCEEMQMLGSKGDDGGAHRDNKPERSSRPASGGRQQQEKPPADEEQDTTPF